MLTPLGDGGERLDEAAFRPMIDFLLERGADGVFIFGTTGEGVNLDPDERQLPMSLVIDPPADLALMQEEIFGPILPVKAYDVLEEAIDHVNGGERPLALYVFAKDDAVAADVLRRTMSGGACVNAAAVHGALPSLPFGGTGQSGSGRHHGIEGFREFSNLRGVFVRGDKLQLYLGMKQEYAQQLASPVTRSSEDACFDQSLAHCLP